MAARASCSHRLQLLQPSRYRVPVPSTIRHANDGIPKKILQHHLEHTVPGTQGKSSRWSVTRVCDFFLTISVYDSLHGWMDRCSFTRTKDLSPFVEVAVPQSFLLLLLLLSSSHGYPLFIWTSWCPGCKPIAPHGNDNWIWFTSS
jgi:thiol-disulfide isomerase/thioredoxin